MTAINIHVVFIVIMLGVLWRVLDVVYVSVTSQIETNILADVNPPTFYHTSEHRPEDSVPESLGQVFELPELGAAGGSNSQNQCQGLTLESNPSKKEHLHSDSDLDLV